MWFLAAENRNHSAGLKEHIKNTHCTNIKAVECWRWYCRDKSDWVLTEGSVPFGFMWISNVSSFIARCLWPFGGASRLSPSQCKPIRSGWLAGLGCICFVFFTPVPKSRPRVSSWRTSSLWHHHRDSALSWAFIQRRPKKRAHFLAANPLGPDKILPMNTAALTATQLDFQAAFPPFKSGWESSP